MKKILLKNINIINDNGDIAYKKDVYVSNGKIEKILDNQNNFCSENTKFHKEKLKEDEENKFKNESLISDEKHYNDYEKIDCTSYYLTPGFVNLHTHSPMNIFKGISEDVKIEDWFDKKIFPYESKLTDEDVYWGCILACLEMIDNGVTAFADLYFCAEKVYEAVSYMGLRADIAFNIFGLAPNYKDQIKDAEEFVRKYKDKNEKIHVRLGPHAPYTCPGDILKEIIDVSKKHNVGIHIHASETEDQVHTSLQSTGKTPIENLYESKAFDIDTIIAHGLWTNEEDLKYINENVYFAFCPKTYMKLNMGYGDIFNLKDYMNYSFGTDGAASSNTLNPLEQARLFALIGKQNTNNAESFNTKYIWKSLMDGHKALKFNTGKIKEGYDADLLIWDLNMANTFPVYDPLTSIIYSSESKNIKYNMVNGEFLKYDGKLKEDTKNIIEKISNIQKNIIARGMGESIVKYN